MFQSIVTELVAASDEELKRREVRAPEQHPGLTGYIPVFLQNLFVELKRPGRFGSQVQEGWREIFCLQFNGAKMLATNERAVDEVAQRFGVEVDGAVRLRRHLQRRSETPLRGQ